ncbi:MAG: T9SS type A sorting domain-containing protein [Candidatus Kapabacteria bacterium]|nr:T9SS type A sorting domain-containing protein [Candidatus Kapabacteria bacterium]
MKKIILILTYIFLLAVVNATAQKTSAYEGTYFIVGFMQNETSIDNRYGGLFLRLFITSTQNAKVKIAIPRSTQIYDTVDFNITKNKVLVYDLPTRLENRESEIIQRKCAEIFSDVPVTVYAFNTQYLTGDSYSVIPVSHWGKEYISLNYPNDQYNLPNDPIGPLDSLSLLEARKNQFMIMGAYNETEVEIIPKAITTRGKQINRSYKVLINKGDCYLVQSLGSQKGTSDLTGSIIRSNKPIGVLSGHVRTSIPQNISRDSKNHLCEMLMPTDSWGRKFITVPFGVNEYGDLIRVTNVKPNTNVTIKYGNTIKNAYLSEIGSFADFAPIGEPAIITSDHPIQVGQFMMHIDDPDDSPYYDPCFVVIPPLEQYVSNIVFETPGNIVAISPPSRGEQFSGHSLAIIADKIALQTLTLDDQYVKNSTLIESNPIGDYFWTRVRLKQGTHQLKADSGSFSGIIYGYGMADAYAMVLGSSLSNPYKKDTIAPTISITEECGQINGLVREYLDSNASGIDIFYVITDLTYNYKWKIDEFNRGTDQFEIKFEAKPTDMLKDGRFAIEVRDKNGNGTKYIFNYQALKLNFPRDIHFGEVDLNDSVCYKFKIINTGDSIEILSANILNDERVRFQILESTPRLLRKNDTINVIVCFEPRGDTTSLNSMLRININCDRIIQIPIKAIISSKSLLTIGYDFGKIRVGDSVCSYIYAINDGNRVLRLDSLDFEIEKYLIYDTTGIFPKTLNPGDTLKIEVCFKPLERGIFSSKFEFKNQSNINNFDYVRGQGIAPEINSLVVDWEKRRVGTINDTTITITNKGEIEARLKFDSFTISNTNFITDEIISIDTLLLPDSSISIKTSFIPAKEGKHSSIANLIIDWKFHQPINIELIGEGTLPIIEVKDIYLGKIPVFSTIDTTATILWSQGSEKLTIDSIVIKNPLQSIDISLIDSKDLILDINDSLRSKINFAPKYAGLHQVFLDVTSDAAPNFRRVQHSIRIWGEAFPLDTPDAEVKIFIPNKIIYCQKSRINIILQNTGNVKLKLTNLILNKGNNFAEWSQPINLPIDIMPDSILSFDIDILPEQGYDGKINIQAIFNDTIVKTADIIIQPIYQNLLVLNPEEIKANPGDTVKVKLSGKFPNRTDLPVDFSLNFSIWREAFLLLNCSELRIYSGVDISKSINLSFSQLYDNISVKSSEKFLVDSDLADWELEFTFLTLLSEKNKQEVRIEASSDECYKKGWKNIFANVTDVCAYTVRSIELLKDIPSIEIYPNPASDVLTININLHKKDRFEIELFDASGKKCYENKIFDLEKGLYSINFEISHLNDGLYLLIISNNDFIKRKLFIISK